MRLSALAIVSICLVSLTLLAQHSSASGGSSSGGGYSGGASSGGSHGGYSGSSGSSASSHSSPSSASHAAGTGARTSNSSSSSKSSSSKQNAEPAKNTGRSFWHPFRKPRPIQNAEFVRPVRCLKEPCPVCPPGGSRNGSACVAANNICASGLFWNGFACGAQYFRFNDCSILLNELTAEQLRMQGQVDPGESLRYRLLLSQYERCINGFDRSPFNSFTFNDAHLLDIP